MHRVHYVVAPNEDGDGLRWRVSCDGRHVASHALLSDAVASAKQLAEACIAADGLAQVHLVEGSAMRTLWTSTDDPPVYA